MILVHMATALPRLYDALIARHLAQYRQMAFISGPRQVGKTTTAKHLAATYLDWDNPTHRRAIAAGPEAVAAAAGLDTLATAPPVLAIDEIHKFGRWKTWLKGFFDLYADRCRVIVTGSSRLDVYRRGGDSLMGRYFPYRMHPLSVGELVTPTVPDGVIRPPQPLAETQWSALWEHGGFPEPFTHRTAAFSRRWRSTRLQQFLREDLRDLTMVRELAQIGMLAEILHDRSCDQIVMKSLADDLHVAPDTVKRWLDCLVSLHIGVLIRPWFTNVTKSLRKEPKWFLRDWSGIDDPGKRAETFVACHLLKAVDGWNDLGLGVFDLRYLRDKQQREVDFVVIRDRRPWFLVEVKAADDRISPALKHYQDQIKAPHAFQVVLDRDFVAADCFTRHDPVVVPARTLLSQLL
jgi:predicted AAA+ superfamily ATPase